jgi:hypothetical protein
MISCPFLLLDLVARCVSLIVAISGLEALTAQAVWESAWGRDADWRR